MNIKSQSSVRLEGEIILVLTEGEAAALDAICGYGPDRFIEWFYANLGKHYLKPHENAMRDLFAKVRAVMPSHLAKFREARKILGENSDKISQYGGIKQYIPKTKD